MDFALTDEQRQLYERISSFARANLNDSLIENDRSGVFDGDKWQLIGKEGIFGACFPEQYGGWDKEVTTAVAMLEALGYGCRDNGLTLSVNGQIWSVQEPILRFGSDEQKERWLPGLMSGEMVGAHAMTEPSSGSDTFALRTTATPDNGGYILKGHKTFIGLAPICDVALVFANARPEHGKWGVTAFLVDATSKGMHRPAPTSKMGLRSSPMGDIIFEDCWVPESARLGPEGAGASIFQDSMEWERSFILTSHVGAMARQVDESVEYARQRQQAGQPIGKYQSVSNRIANMRLRLEVSRLLLYQAAWLKDNDQKAQLESALANLQISESFVESSMDAIRTHGGIGYVTDSEIERDLRDAVGGVIYAGTSDIQRQVIARLLGL